MNELRVAFFRRLQNSPYFLRIHDARTVKQKVWSEACETRAVRARVALSLLTMSHQEAFSRRMANAT